MSQGNGVSRKFRLIDDAGWVGGVCAGIAYHFGFPVWIVRLACFIAVVGYGVGVLPYIFLWIFVPDVESIPDDYEERCG